MFITTLFIIWFIGFAAELYGQDWRDEPETPDNWRKAALWPVRAFKWLSKGDDK